MIFHRVDPPDAVPAARSFAGIFSNTTQFHSSGFLQLPRRVENRLDNLPIPHSAEQLSIPRGSLPRSAWGFAEKILDEHEMPAVQKPHWRRSSRASRAGEFLHRPIPDRLDFARRPDGEHEAGLPSGPFRITVIPHSPPNSLVPVRPRSSLKRRFL